MYDTTKPDGTARKIKDTERMAESIGQIALVRLAEGIKNPLESFIENYDNVTTEPVLY